MRLYYSGNSVHKRHPEYVLGDKANIMLSYVQLVGGKEKQRLADIIAARKRKAKRKHK